MVSSIGLILGSKGDNEEEAENKETDWGMVFMCLKNRGFSHQEILNLSYPQFNAYMNNINNELTYSITIPYMGSGEKEENKDAIKIEGKEQLASIIADLNKGW